MIDGSVKCNRKLGFELQSLRVIEWCSKGKAFLGYNVNIEAIHTIICL